MLQTLPGLYTMKTSISVCAKKKRCINDSDYDYNFDEIESSDHIEHEKIIQNDDK